jgi:glutathione S-transferase
MKLRYSPTSPFVRKVTVIAIETGLEDRIEWVPTDLKNPDEGLANANPLAKVPALITDDGVALFDSPVICEYLDSLHDGPKLFPPAGRERWAALRHQALADGLADATIARMVETRRPEDRRSPEWLEKQKGKVDRALDALDAEAGSLGEALTIAHVSIVCALGYLDLRFPDHGWRAARRTLAGWYEALSQRRSISETIPREAS